MAKTTRNGDARRGRYGYYIYEIHPSRKIASRVWANEFDLRAPRVGTRSYGGASVCRGLAPRLLSKTWFFDEIVSGSKSIWTRTFAYGLPLSRRKLSFSSGGNYSRDASTQPAAGSTLSTIESEEGSAQTAALTGFRSRDDAFRFLDSTTRKGDETTGRNGSR
jgi:hypothetical protein